MKKTNSFGKRDLICANRDNFLKLRRCWSEPSSSATLVLEKAIWRNRFHRFIRRRSFILTGFFGCRETLTRKNPKDEMIREVEQKRKENSWIVEGVFGELAELFLPRAQTLIYLDMDWATCQSGLKSRGSESSRQKNPVEAEENFIKLLLWAEQYWTRTDLCSHAGHLRLFSDFTGVKLKFSSRPKVDEFLKQAK